MQIIFFFGFLSCVHMGTCITLERSDGSRNADAELNRSSLISIPEPNITHGIKEWTFKFGSAPRWEVPTMVSLENQTGTPNKIKCLQFSPKGELSGEEDCLYLNVMAPLDAQNALLPVVFHIHGGGYMLGSRKKAKMVQWVVKSGLITVTVNYRLGAMGFFAHPEVQEPNVAIADQSLALRWVQQHISSFGGDPSKVTIHGGSAGGRAIVTNVLSSHSQGMFRAAVASAFGFWNMFTHDIEEVYNSTIRDCVASVPKCRKTTSTSSQLECLRQVDVSEMLSSFRSGCPAMTKIDQPSSRHRFAKSRPGGMVPDMPETLCYPQNGLGNVPMIVSDVIRTYAYFANKKQFGWNLKQSFDDVFEKTLQGIPSASSLDRKCASQTFLRYYHNPEDINVFYKETLPQEVALQDAYANLWQALMTTRTHALAPSRYRMIVTNEPRGSATHVYDELLMWNNSNAGNWISKYSKAAKDPECKKALFFQNFISFVKTGEYWPVSEVDGVGCPSYGMALPASTQVVPPETVGGVPIFLGSDGWTNQNLFKSKTINMWYDMICKKTLPAKLFECISP